MSINQRLDALASTIKSRLPYCTIYAPPQSIASSDTFPVIQIHPYREHLERTEAGLWGNAMREQPGSHGPDKYRIAILQSPTTPGLDEQDIKRRLNDLVDTVRDALVANPQLADDAGVPQALDAADYILMETDAQDQMVSYHQRNYIGCYLTVDVQKLRESGGQ